MTRAYTQDGLHQIQYTNDRGKVFPDHDEKTFVNFFSLNNWKNRQIFFFTTQLTHSNRNLYYFKNPQGKYKKMFRILSLTMIL